MENANDYLRMFTHRPWLRFAWRPWRSEWTCAVKGTGKIGGRKGEGDSLFAALLSHPPASLLCAGKFRSALLKKRAHPFFEILRSQHYPRALLLIAERRRKVSEKMLVDESLGI